MFVKQILMKVNQISGYYNKATRIFRYTSQNLMCIKKNRLSISTRYI